MYMPEVVRAESICSLSCFISLCWDGVIRNPLSALIPLIPFKAQDYSFHLSDKGRLSGLLSEALRGAPYLVGRIFIVSWTRAVGNITRPGEFCQTTYFYLCVLQKAFEDLWDHQTISEYTWWYYCNEHFSKLISISCSFREKNGIKPILYMRSPMLSRTQDLPTPFLFA